MFTQALVRPPGANFAAGLTTCAEGAPELDRALDQHARYCEALRDCGLAVLSAPADERYPDGTFVEDTAVIAGRLAVITRPGAPSRQGETAGVAAALRGFDLELHSITAPGTLDGGDICQAERHFLIGLSNRTNLEGARQLGAILQRHGYTSSIVDIRSSRSLLHLKSGIAYLGDDRLLAVADLVLPQELTRYERVTVPAGEEYAANCVRVNDEVLIPAGYPGAARLLRELGYAARALDVSEFRKMDGGLSCLSLRF